MNLVTIIGARPQFIKSAPVSAALRTAGCGEYLVHTGQHYDPLMSQVFFDELGLSPPTINLEVGSASHGAQTAQMLQRTEEVLIAQKPDMVLVYGDTNSTIAGALAAVKLHIPVAHVEAGLRSFNRTMPEEHNRVLTDHCSELLLCPTQTAVDNLAAEGIRRGVHLVGDVMYDAALHFAERARMCTRLLDELGVRSGEYVLATVHRPSNTDQFEVLHEIVAGLAQSGLTVIFPVHPRTHKMLALLRQKAGAALFDKLHCIEPLGYLDMLMLEQRARAVVTDSGGVQKEAYFMSVPCVTVRSETEWVETVQSGWNRLVPSERNAIAQALATLTKPDTHPDLFGDGTAARKCAALIVGSTHG
jgi:UDP-GlcNAc3NAcA epimerase